MVAAVAAWPAKTPRKLVSAAAGDGPGHANSRAPSPMAQATRSSVSNVLGSFGAFGKGSLAYPIVLCSARDIRASIPRPQVLLIAKAKLQKRRLESPNNVLTAPEYTDHRPHTHAPSILRQRRNAADEPSKIK